MFDKKKDNFSNEEKTNDVFRPAKGDAKVVIGNGVTMTGEIKIADEVQIAQARNDIYSVSILEKRISGRADENKDEKRVDDNLEVLKNRLLEYVDQTEPLISYYSSHENYIVINGMNDISKVSEDIKNNLNKLK